MLKTLQTNFSAPNLHSYYATSYTPPSPTGSTISNKSAKPKQSKWSRAFNLAKTQLFDTSKKPYYELQTKKLLHQDSILQNEDLALQIAIAESCHTYMHENNFKISNVESVVLSGSLALAKNKINRIMPYFLD